MAASHRRVENGAYAVEHVKDSVVLYENGEPKFVMLSGEADIVEELLRRLREAREKEGR